MPEGPELYMAAKYINAVCQNRLFDKIVKSDVTKCAAVEWTSTPFTINAVSRGKEMAMILKSASVNENEKGDKNNNKQCCYIFFHFGMSGCFKLTSLSGIPKHSHLRFFTQDSKDVLNFIDVRRFGGWQTKFDLEWSTDRGPDPVHEYEKFRANVLNAIEDDPVFQKPLCEVLLNQHYFNGIGNYLRAEIMHRANIAPFSKAYDHLQKLTADITKPEEKNLDNDILFLCKKLQEEMVGLQLTPYGDPSEEGNWSRFRNWCQCYMKAGAKSLSDRNGRTVWYFGEAGPLAPKAKPLKRKRHNKKTMTSSEPLIKAEKLDSKDVKELKKSIKTVAVKRVRKQKVDLSDEKTLKTTSSEKLTSRTALVGNTVAVTTSTHQMTTRSRSARKVD